MVLIMRVCRANNCTKMRGFVAVVTIKTVRPSDRTSQPQMDEHKPSKMQLQQGLQSCGVETSGAGPALERVKERLRTPTTRGRRIQARGDAAAA